MADTVIPENTSDDSIVGQPCGLIMPISATSSHEKSHWDSMLELLGRAIANAGYLPRPVWINSSTDRVSERIIGNIFDHPIVIADITDLNPNVMFELGLRLASRKPTVVIMEDGGIIPFDIRDFHIHIYPVNLSILKMERFLTELSADLIAKTKSYNNDQYVPFLSKIVVDVVSPDKREITMNDFVLEQLQELNRRVANIDVRARVKRPHRPSSLGDRISGLQKGNTLVLFASVGIENAEKFKDEAMTFSSDVIELNNDNSIVQFAIVCKKGQINDDNEEFRGFVANLIRIHDAKSGVSRRVAANHYPALS